MKKNEFIQKLKQRLKEIDQTERDNIINYYNELIDDKIESGCLEEEAINDLGTIDEIVLRMNLKEEVKKESNLKHQFNENKKTIIIILIVTFPLWIGLFFGAIGLLIGLLSAVFSLLLSGFIFILVGFIGTIAGIINLILGTGTWISLGLYVALIGVGCLLTPLMIRLGKYLLIQSKKLINYVRGKLYE